MHFLEQEPVATTDDVRSNLEPLVRLRPNMLSDLSLWFATPFRLLWLLLLLLLCLGMFVPFVLLTADDSTVL
jgi:hypothetical protein